MGTWIVYTQWSRVNQECDGCFFQPSVHSAARRKKVSDVVELLNSNRSFHKSFELSVELLGFLFQKRHFTSEVFHIIAERDRQGEGLPSAVSQRSCSPNPIELKLKVS